MVQGKAVGSNILLSSGHAAQLLCGWTIVIVFLSGSTFILGLKLTGNRTLWLVSR